MNAESGMYHSTVRARRASRFMLISSLAMVLLAPLLPEPFSTMVYLSFISIILISSIFTMQSSRAFKFSVPAVIIIQIIGVIIDVELLITLPSLTAIIIFTWVVFRLVRLIIKQNKVSATVLMNSITVYILIGIVFSLFGLVIFYLQPQAYSYSEPITRDSIFYFTFVTMTTLGYGEIVPTLPLSKSLAVLTAMSGQIYLTFVVAVLVGKYLSSGQHSINS